MGLIRRIGKGLKALTDEINKPDSFAKGEDFEEYVRKIMFPIDSYSLIHKSHDYRTNNSDYVETSLKPDFLFQDKSNGMRFYVEVKWRRGIYNRDNKIEWCKPHQLKRYKEIENGEHKVFIVLGFGDNPNRPEEVIFFPLSGCNFSELYDSFLDKYQFFVGKPLFSKYLWNLK